jgi:hypothetical protein
MMQLVLPSQRLAPEPDGTYFHVSQIGSPSRGVSSDSELRILARREHGFRRRPAVSN